MGRAKIAVVNSGLSLANLVVTNLLQFVYRTIIVYVLGIEYAGITGLCLNVIQLFALSELGISWAVSFYLYKPLKEQNHKQIAEIIYFLKRLYRYVGLFILAGGLATIPFLEDIIKGGNGITHLKLIFAFYLINTATSYLFFSYYQILAVADRRNYIMFVPQTLGNIILVCLQIIIVYFYHSFVGAVILTTISTISVNYLIRRKVIRLYPYLVSYKDVRIESTLKKEIIKYIKSTMLYKVSLTIMTSSTGIIISHYIGLAVLGLYSNYMLIVDTIKSLILSLINPMTSVVGEITTNADFEEKERVYKRLNFLMDWGCFFCAVSLYCLLTPFISLWLGDKLTLPTSTVALIATYFYIEFVTAFSTKFRDACGLNSIGKFRPLITTMAMVILAILLVPQYGLNGIIVSLLISRITTLTWFEPWIVHRYVLNKSVLPYYGSLIGKLILTVIIALLTKWIINLLPQEGVLGFVFDCVICLVVPNLIYLIIHYKFSEFLYYRELIVKRLSHTER